MSIGKLYYTPTSCGAASFIIAHYGGLEFESEEVVLQTHKTVNGTDFYTVNPKGNVPTLVLPSGTLLNENIAILTYVGDKARAGGKVPTITPAEGTEERYVYLNALSFVATEIHQGFSPIFRSDESLKPKLKENLARKLKVLNDQFLSKSAFLTGNHFTPADSYLYICLSWGQYLGVSYENLPNVVKYYEHIKNLEFVKAAHNKMAEKK